MKCCKCPDWIPNVDYINDAMQIADIHHFASNLTPFLFCPYCGTKLNEVVEVAMSSTLFKEDIMDIEILDKALELPPKYNCECTWSGNRSDLKWTKKGRCIHIGDCPQCGATLEVVDSSD